MKDEAPERIWAYTNDGYGDRMTDHGTWDTGIEGQPDCHPEWPHAPYIRADLAPSPAPDVRMTEEMVERAAREIAREANREKFYTAVEAREYFDRTWPLFAERARKILRAALATQKNDKSAGCSNCGYEATWGMGKCAACGGPQ